MASISRSIRSDDHSSEELSNHGPIIHFSRVDNLKRTVQDVQDALLKDPRRGEDSLILCQNIPYDEFQQLCGDDSSIISHCRFLYLEDIKTLWVKMPPSAPHEAAASRFANKLYLKAVQMNLEDAMSCRGGAISHMGQVHKSPDGSWGPANKDYCTLILEVGLSQSEHGLSMDVQKWFEAPNSRVKQVVTIKICLDTPTIIFQKWEEATREGAATRSASKHKMTQEVRVRRFGVVTVTAGDEEGPFSLQFLKIFERPPVPGTTEGDIEFGPLDLLYIATDVWRLQGEMSWTEA
jgi:hypothetical protein